MLKSFGYATKLRKSRVCEIKVEVVPPRRHHLGANQWEIWLRDLDGYTVFLSRPDGTECIGATSRKAPKH
jgi:hypothetical protein